MGIKGLLQLLKPITTDVEMKSYAGKKVAVDGHCWLHRGTFGCAYELGVGKETETYVAYFIHMVNMLLYNKVTPIIVFDGQSLPMKEVTTRQRAIDRARHLDKGNAFVLEKETEKAIKSFQQAVSITEEMIYTVIKALDKLNVQYVIAPYEADPQLTYMLNMGHADAVITEDSDLLVFGCRKVITKLTRVGIGRQIEYKDIFTSEELRMTKFTPDMFRYMCITSGCDYLPSLYDIGLKKAQDLVEHNSNLEKLFFKFNMLRSKHIVEPYVEKFMKANAAFLYQFVFDINTRTYTRLNPVPQGEDVSLLGTNPQDRYIPLLRANKAIILPKLDYKETNKENINPWSQFDDDEEFDEIKFDDTTLKQVEDLLQKVEPSALSDKTNISKSNTTKPLFSVFVDPIIAKNDSTKTINGSGARLLSGTSINKITRPALGGGKTRPAFGDKTNNASSRPIAFGDKTNSSSSKLVFGDKTNASLRPAFGDKTNSISSRPAFGDKTNTVVSRPAFGDKTNRPKTISLSKSQKRKTLDTATVSSDLKNSLGVNTAKNFLSKSSSASDTTKKRKAITTPQMSDRELANLVYAAMMGDTKAMKQREDMLLEEYKASTKTITHIF